MRRLSALMVDGFDVAEVRGPPSWIPGGLATRALLLLAAGTAAVLIATLMSTGPAGNAAVPPHDSAEPSAAASQDDEPVDASPGPTDGVASSRRLVVDFDLLPTGTPIDGWTLSAGGRLEAAAQPTAVDRSARLDGEGGATACQDLDLELAGLEATFMIDGLADGELTLLALALDEGSTYSLTLNDEGGRLVAGGQSIELVPGTWYRWVFVSGDGGYEQRLLAADGTLLAEAAAAGQTSARATEFCMTAARATRLYLSDLTVEMQ